jgi:hypothetical protein
MVSRGSDDETGRDIITKESVSSHDVTRNKGKKKVESVWWLSYVTDKPELRRGVNPKRQTGADAE